MLSMIHREILIFDEIIRITVKVPSIRIVLSMGHYQKMEKFRKAKSKKDEKI